MSYIIYRGEAIAETNCHIKSGTEVEFSNLRAEENINAARDWNLVNASFGKISNAKKWEKIDEVRMPLSLAVQINEKLNSVYPEYYLL